jgi:arylsulfate sulfotransferase
MFLGGVFKRILAPVLLLTPVLAAGSQPTLTSSLSSGQPVGTTIRWTATYTAGMVYQFSIAYGSNPYYVVRDAALTNTFLWTPLQEGTYSIRVFIIPENYQGTPQVAYASFKIVSRITGGTPVVNTTNNPLVALYSAPPCGTGSIYVVFGINPSTESGWQQTNTLTCSATLSSNFYVGGMMANTTYSMQQVVTNGSTVTQGPMLTFTTGSVSQALPTLNLAVDPTSQTSLADRVLLHGMLNTQNLSINVPFATNLAGNVIWYYNGFSAVQNVFYYLTRPVAGGTFLILASEGKADDILAEIDMAGNIIRQTDLLRIDAQLAALGDEEVVALHHEAIRFPNGQTLVLGMIERPTSNGGAILGDMIIALDQNFQVKWTWDAFNYLSTSRGPVLGETCEINYGAFCPASDPYAIDWLHSNSLGYTPDHNLILSMRDQDWVVKINYQDGTGLGNIIWTLGAGGSFIMQSNLPYPWFSHQHDVQWVNTTTNEITLFDNGNTRCVYEGSPCDSRGQVLQINESTMTASLVFSGDLGVFADSLGSAQLLTNGDYHFGPGYIEPALTSAAMEVNSSNTVEYNMQIDATEYRTFRLWSLYVEPYGQ